MACWCYIAVSLSLLLNIDLAEPGIAGDIGNIAVYLIDWLVDWLIDFTAV